MWVPDKSEFIEQFYAFRALCVVPSSARTFRILLLLCLFELALCVITQSPNLKLSFVTNPCGTMMCLFSSRYNFSCS